jgi:hypothetical protein
MTTELSTAKYPSRFVKSADGTKIYADATGNRSPGLPTIVLIHGGAMMKEAYNPIIEDPRWTSRVFLASPAPALIHLDQKLIIKLDRFDMTLGAMAEAENH